MTWQHAVVIGASGGIGKALADELEQRGTEVVRLSRSAEDAESHIDLQDEASIEAAAAWVAKGKAPDLILVATGYLHEQGEGPEKDWRQLSADHLARNFAINATGPALVAKHFLPLLRDDGRAGLAALSARVGSISDNRLGGWYGYRASKAALNMLIRTFSIELKRKKKNAFCIALHPGTVDTALSDPFQKNVPEGKLFSREHSAKKLLEVLEGCDADSTGRIFAWDGTEIAP
ncbi:SDR family NAD(P)-dependent oxidoreductase [Erythrobacter litoralis]|uniref:SDR family NAD(P)-dependent oxidoreductase n=1 Tax=Erythrobacter litoralis TaxID=39960 RepID=UPI0024357AB6|nr:SDR family NAD(P)-dependent oxidoreductase [Erythrobacter litoralis]MDG6078399.1 SDR family NAD(P)-dependent oxidoreductase [Erythrobacter litoralis]